MFNGQLFRQVDGAPMGGCVSPSLANIFLSFHERKWINQCPVEFKPTLYRRYVDDTFVLFNSNDQINSFLMYLNNQHPNISFTHELEKNSRISFLDVNIKKCLNHFDTGIFRKPTTTGLGMKFDSAISSTYKRSLISCLVDRAYKICSSYILFVNELDYLKKYFSQNNFPLNLVENTIFHKINSFYNKKSLSYDVPKQIVYSSLPFFGQFNKYITKEIQDLTNTFFPQIHLKLVFKNNFTIGSFFRYKDKMPTYLQSKVVYLYTCDQCRITYCGETTRHLQTRIAEHIGISDRTNRPVSKPLHSSIRDHAEQSDHPIIKPNFKILSTCNNNQDIRTIESIFIHKLKPNLNNTEASIPLHILG